MKTNHNSLRFFLEQKELNERQQKWVSKVQAYDFEIEYVKGKNNVVANSLSRRPATLSLLEISADWKARLLVEYSKNRFACEVLDGQVQADRGCYILQGQDLLGTRVQTERTDYASSS